MADATDREKSYVAQLRALLRSPDALGLLEVALQSAREQGVAEERAKWEARIVEESEGLWCDDFDTDYRFAGTFPSDDPAFDEDPPIRAALIRIEEPADG